VGTAITSGVFGLLGGGVASLLAAWSRWGEEKRKSDRQYRPDDCDRALLDFAANPHGFGVARPRCWHAGGFGIIISSCTISSCTVAPGHPSAVRAPAPRCESLVRCDPFGQRVVERSVLADAETVRDVFEPSGQFGVGLGLDGLALSGGYRLRPPRRRRWGPSGPQRPSP